MGAHPAVQSSTIYANKLAITATTGVAPEMGLGG